jgi:hypothetical protein
MMTVRVEVGVTPALSVATATLLVSMTMLDTSVR